MAAHDDEINSDPYGLLEGLKAGKYRVLRQSTIGTADTCLQRLEYALDPTLPYSTGEARAVGTAYHAALEQYYRMRQAEQCPVEMTTDTIEFLDFRDTAWASFFAESQTAGFVWQDGKEAALNKIEHMLRAYFDGGHYWPAEYKVLAVEHTFLLPLTDGWIVKGTVDLILEDPNGWVLCVDHKTAGKPWKKGKEKHRSTPQPSWYVHFIGQLFPNVAPLFVFDILTYKGVFERRQVAIDPAHIAGTLAKAKLVTDLIDQGGPFPPNVSSFLCDVRWCDWYRICPFGDAFDGVSVPVEIGVKTPV